MGHVTIDTGRSYVEDNTCKTSYHTCAYLLADIGYSE